MKVETMLQENSNMQRKKKGGLIIPFFFFWLSEKEAEKFAIMQQ